MEESEWFEANQEVMVGEGDWEANQKEEPLGRSWGFVSTMSAGMGKKDDEREERLMGRKTF